MGLPGSGGSLPGSGGTSPLNPQPDTPPVKDAAWWPWCNKKHQEWVGTAARAAQKAVTILPPVPPSLPDPADDACDRIADATETIAKLLSVQNSLLTTFGTGVMLQLQHQALALEVIGHQLNDSLLSRKYQRERDTQHADRWDTSVTAVTARLAQLIGAIAYIKTDDLGLTVPSGVSDDLDPDRDVTNLLDGVDDPPTVV